MDSFLPRVACCITQQVNSLVQQRGQGQNFEAEAKVSRGRGQGYEAETEAKILASRPVWPRGFNISDLYSVHTAQRLMSKPGHEHMHEVFDAS